MLPAFSHTHLERLADKLVGHRERHLWRRLFQHTLPQLEDQAHPAIIHPDPAAPALIHYAQQLAAAARLDTRATEVFLLDIMGFSTAAIAGHFALPDHRLRSLQRRNSRALRAIYNRGCNAWFSVYHAETRR